MSQFAPRDRSNSFATPPGGWASRAPEAETFDGGQSERSQMSRAPPPPPSMLGLGSRSNAGSGHGRSHRSHRSSTTSMHHSSSDRAKSGESSRTTRSNATTSLPSTNDHNGSSSNNKMHSSSPFVVPNAATRRQSLSRTSTFHRGILRSGNPSSRVSVANSQQTEDTWTTQQIMDGVADVGGFSKDSPRWKSRPEDQSALSRMVGYRQLAAPSTIASLATGATATSIWSLGPDSNPLQLPALPETYWEGLDTSNGVDFRDPAIQKKLMDNIAFFNNLLNKLAYQRRMYECGIESPNGDSVQWNAEHLLIEHWAQRSVTHYNFMLLRCSPYFTMQQKPGGPELC